MGLPRRTLRLLRWLTPLLAVLSAAPASAYVLRKDSKGMPVRWEGGPVRFVADAQLDAQLGSTGALAALRSALQTYEAAGVGLRLELAAGTPRPVGFDFAQRDANENAIVALSQWEYEPSAIAVTVLTVDAGSHRILDADIALNAQHRRFRVLPPEGAGPQSAWDDVQNTVTHEVGHAMGLAHNPAAPDAVMFPTAARGETSKRSLSTDDHAGLEALYSAAALEGETAPPGGCSALPSSGAGGLAALLLVLALLARQGQRVPVRPAAQHGRPPPASRLGLPLALLASLAAPAVRASALEREPPQLEEAALVLTGRVVRVQTLVPAQGERLLHSEVEVEVERCIRGACPRRLVVVRPGGRWGQVEQFVEGLELPASGESLGVVVDRTEPTPQQPSARTTRVYALGRARDLQAFARGLARLERATASGPAPAPKEAPR